tara:strand:+ start:1169 stop:1375 length:207 start_codon:yes stop_codon:yes gene_type:complete
MTVTGTYESTAQINNTREDLIAIGIPQEQIFVDKKNHHIKVTIADVTEPEIEEIFKSHNLHSMTTSTH